MPDWRGRRPFRGAFLPPRQRQSGFAETRCREDRAATPISDLHPKSHLDDSVMGNLEEIGCPARDPVEKREDRKGYRLHRRFRLAANDGLMRKIVVLVIEI